MNLLLKDLEKAKLVKKKSDYKPGLTAGPGKQPVYYWVPFVYGDDIIRTFQTKESLVQELNEAHAKIVDIGYRLEDATQLLRQCQGKKYDPRKSNYPTGF
jgi:hypothetical protein